ncbi:hypothetical protein MBLNU459_g5845t1 [Dothideomycetes sp. NU459]
MDSLADQAEVTDVATLRSCHLSESDEPAIISTSENSLLTLTKKALRASVSCFQSKLANVGVTHGDVVAISLPNSAELAVAFLATTSQRAICAPLNPAYKQAEFEFYLEDLKPKLLLVPRGTIHRDADVVRAAHCCGVTIAEILWAPDGVTLMLKVMEKQADHASVHVAEAQEDDIALVLHTSGTTGRPKAVPLTHKNLYATMRNIQATYKLTPADRTLLVMPLFHVHGILAGFLTPLFTGGSVIIPQRFSVSRFWDEFISYKATWYTAVPTIHQLLLQNPAPDPMPKIRFVRSCSSPLAPAIHQRLEAFMHAPVLEAYAMTEASHQMSSNELPPGLRKQGSVGLPQGVDLAIMDDNGEALTQGSIGEVCVRGPNVTAGYLSVGAMPVDKATAFFADGFFRTGDQGYLDEDGFLYLTGRIKELINKGGEKISPIETDNLFMQHPNVAEAVSFAVDDELYGQNVAVAIRTRPCDVEIPAAELIAWFAGKAAKFKVPKQIYLVKEIPKTATGKVQRRLVAKALINSL